MTSSAKSTFDFGRRRALFLSAHKAAIYHWQKGELRTSYLFDTTQEGRENFERYLRETAKIPVYILLDVFEEEYRQETIPHVFGSDRAAILERKTSRLFRDTPYHYTRVQGREQGGRRDDRILLSAITNPDIVRPWVSMLDKYKVPLVSINSLPLFTESLLGDLPEASNRMLIISLESISGLRQTFFQNSEFRISRVVQTPRYGTTAYAPHIIGEVEKIQRYLTSVRLISIDDPLDIYFLMAGELLEELNQHYSDSGMVRYHLLDINELMQLSGLSRKVSIPFSDQFFIYQYLKRMPQNCYATPADRRYALMRRMRYTMSAASILLLLGGAIWSGFNFVEGLTLKQDSLAAEKKAQFYSARYKIARERLPHTPVEPEDLQVAVTIADTLKKYKASPIDMIKFISEGLDSFTDVRLDNFEWAAGTDPNLKIGSSKAGTQDQGVVGYTNVSSTNTGYRFYQIALIKGHLEPFEGDFREAIATINQFAETLRNGKSVHDISIVSFPLDISSSASLQGNTQSVRKRADFTIRIVLGIGNET
ncbi:MAG: hypothetical protein ACE5GZ_06125 [Gammaproteobacteria bacterium]